MKDIKCPPVAIIKVRHMLFINMIQDLIFFYFSSKIKKKNNAKRQKSFLIQNI